MGSVEQFEQQTSEQENSKSVLLVDDDRQIRDLFREILMDEGFSVATASNAEDAVAFAEKHDVDLYVVDVFMKGKGGLWAIDKLRNLKPAAKIIAMSGGWGASSPEQVVNAASAIGANRVIQKPFKIEILVEMATSMVGKPLKPQYTP